MSDAQVIEAMLLRWNESPTGRTVTFLLPTDEGPHPFRGLKTGPSHGERLAISVARIADDETQHEVTKPTGKSFAQRAGILCNEGAFGRFLSERYLNALLEASADYSGDNPHEDEMVAAATLRAICGVRSRRELTDGTPAGRRYLELDAEYAAWLRHG